MRLHSRPVQLVPVQTIDLDILLVMIHALGKSDGVAHIATTRSHLLDALFSDVPAAFAAWIHVDGERAGFVIYSWKWGTFTGTSDLYMQAIYLEPAFRRCGLGRATLGELAKIALARGCSLMEWFSVRDKTESRQFYDRVGAVAADHMLVQRLPAKAMQQLAEACTNEQTQWES